MNQDLVHQLSIHTCFFTVFALLLRLRKASIHGGLIAWILRIAMASLAIAYLQKAFSRMEGSFASEIDLWREVSLLLVIVCRIQIKSKTEGI